MKAGNIYLYILIMAVVTYLIRMLPMLLVKKEITNVTVRSFLYYVPYVTLAVMTFPAIVQATQGTASGILALIIGVIMAWRGAGLFKVALSCCAIVLVSEFFLI